MTACRADESAQQRSHAALRRYASATAPDELFLDDMQARIDAAWRERENGVAAATVAMNDTQRVLLVGYGGAGNTGADLRTIETIVQLRRLFASREIAITLLALGDCFDHPILATTPKLISALPYVPDALDAAVREADIVLNVEGSTYTSKFSDTLAGVLIGSVALAHAHGRFGFAYGVDTGGMSDALTRFVKRNAGQSGYVMCRNEAARAQLAALGVKTMPAADTAWSYRAPPSRWTGEGVRLAALCPANPYWWPVQADAARVRELEASGEASPHRYGQLHFHSWDDTRAGAYDDYLDRCAAIASGLRKRGYTLLLVGMEQLDRSACADLAARLPFHAELVVRGVYPLDAVAAAVAHARCVVTTRYHAAVLAISHGVPVVGLSMDARIDRLLDEAGCAQWSFACDATDAAASCLDRIDSLDAPNVRNAVLEKFARYAGAQRTRFNEMGARLLSIVDAKR